MRLSWKFLFVALAMLSGSMAANSATDVEVVYGSAAGDKGSAGNLLNNPTGLYMDGDTIVIADSKNDRIISYTPSTNRSTKYSTGGALPSDVVKRGSTYFYTSAMTNKVYKDNSAVQCKNESGASEDCSFSMPSSIAFGPGSSDLLIADQNRVQLYDYLDQQIFTIVGTKNACEVVSLQSVCGVGGIYMSSNNMLYVADLGNKRVVRIDLGANPTSRQAPYKFETVVSGVAARSVSLDAEGNIFVVDIGTDEVLMYPAGLSMGSVVAGDGAQATTLYSLYNPADAVVDDDRYIYVADKMNNRIVKWPPAGVLIGMRVPEPFSVQPTSSTAAYVIGGSDLYKCDGSTQVCSTALELNSPSAAVVTDDMIYVCDRTALKAFKDGAKVPAFQIPYACVDIIQSGSGIYFTGVEYPRGRALGNYLWKWDGTSGSTPERTDLPSGAYWQIAMGIEHFYVVDVAGNKIMKGRPGANDWDAVVLQEGVELCFPSGVAFDLSSGDLYVADQGNERILWLDIDSTSNPVAVETFVASAGQEDLPSTSQLASPNRLGFYSSSRSTGSSPGYLFVTDQRNNRVIRFRTDETRSPVKPTGECKLSDQ